MGVFQDYHGAFNKTEYAGKSLLGRTIKGTPKIVTYLVIPITDTNVDKLFDSAIKDKKTSILQKYPGF